MPRRPRTPCTAPGCPNLVDGGGRCPDHKRMPGDRKPFAGAVRTEDRAGVNLYGSARWQKARATHLSHSPFCVQCGDVAMTVDHDPPHDGRPETFWDTATWTSLCAGCHNAKSAREANRKAQARREADASAMPNDGAGGIK